MGEPDRAWSAPPTICGEMREFGALRSALVRTLAQIVTLANPSMIEAQAGPKLLTRAPLKDLFATTCVPGYGERLQAYNLAEGKTATRSVPAAQVGSSFYIDAQAIVFDPASSRVWVPKN